MVLLLVLYALFAMTFILAREAALAVPPVFFIAIRMICAGSLLLGFIRLRSKEKIQCKASELPWFLGIIIFHIYLAYVLEFISLQYLSAAKVSLLYNLTPFITAIFAYIFFKETLSARKWIGLLLGFCAFIPLLITKQTIQESHEGTLYAQVLLIIAISSSCIGWIFMKKLITRFKHSYIFINGIGMFFGGLIALIHSYFFEIWPPLESLVFNIPFLRSLFLLILVGNIICYNLYGKLLHIYSTTTLSFFGITTPLFAALFGWLWLSETVTYSFFITIFFAAISLYIFYKDELKTLHL